MTIFSSCGDDDDNCFSFSSSSPVIVADDANIDVAARRITWGKFLNSGQTCIAPDYVLCTPGKRDRIVEVMRKTLVEFFGSEV